MIERWLSELTGSDVAGLLIALGALVTGLFSWLSSRDARATSTAPLSAATQLMKATEEVNRRAADSLDVISKGLIGEVGNLRSASSANTAKLDEILRRVSRRRK